MTAETASTRGSVFARARLRFRHWRRNRPFWGGLFMLLSGLEMLYAGNEDIGNLQIHLGVPGFQSYLIPLFLLLCGALVWATPAQRTFYGIIGVADAVYSLVGTNLGGFIIGFLLGILGGGLTVAWVPVKRRDPATTESDEQNAQEPPGVDATDDDEEIPAAGGSPLHDTLPTATTSPLVPPRPRHADPGEADGDTEEVQEGKQGRSFPRPRHAADEPGIAGGPGTAGEANRSASRFRWSPRTAVALIAAVSVASIGIVTLQAPTAASAEACANPALTQLLNDAKNGRVATKPGAAKHTSARTSTAQKPAKKSSAANGSAMNGSAILASAPEDSGPLGPIADLINHLLTGGTSATSGLTPSASPTGDPTPTADPAPSASPTGDPTPTVTPSPTTSKTSTPTSKPSSKPTGRPAPPSTRHPAQPSPSPSAICAVTKVLTAASGQPTINDKPSKMTADLLTMSGLSFDGIVDLPTGSGSMKVMQFSMNSSTSTPFELQPLTDTGEIDIKSSKLTVSSNVKFYCTEIKGNLLGLVPVDFTVDSPPPLVTSDLYFTNVTIALAFVYADKLTANNLDIKVT